MARKIGDTLRESRISAGISVEQISDILTRKGYKASIKTIYSWENGNSSPSPDALLEMCDIYKIDNILATFGYDGYKEDGSLKLNLKENQIIEKYRSLDPHGQQTVDLILDREAERVKQLLDTQGQLRQSQSQVDSLKLQLSHERTVSRFFAYYGRVAAAGTSVEFSDIAAGVRAYPENEINKQADYVIGVNGDSMEPEYFDGDVVYVQKTDHIEIGDIGIFQRGNSIYIKKVGENGLISLNPDYPPLMADGDRIMVLGKVLGKAEEI